MRGMHERAQIKLNADDRAALAAVVANRNSPQKYVWRAKIVLLTADGHGTAEIMRQTGKAKTVIWRWQERFGTEGTAGLLRDKTRPSRIPPLDPKIAERVVALTLAGPPADGHGQGDRDQRQLGAAHLAGAWSAAASGASVQAVQ
jgi:Winged helix-turn helix